MRITQNLLVLTLVFVCCGLSYGQEPAAALLPAPKAEATVYVYRNFYHVTFGKEAPTITINGETIAVLDEGRYLVAKVPVGLVVVRSGKKKDNAVDFDALPGETYYMRVRAHPGRLFARFEMLRVTREEAKQDAEKEKIRYVASGDIKSPRVIKDAPTP